MKKFKMRLRTVLITCSVVLCASCKTSEVTLSESGVQSDILTAENKFADVELIAILDNSVVVLDDSLIEIPRQNISALHLSFPYSWEWIVAVAGLEVVPAIYLLTDDRFEDKRGLGTFYLVLTGLTASAFSASGPKTRFEQPWDGETLQKLRTYCRYPQGLTREQLDFLRQMPLKPKTSE